MELGQQIARFGLVGIANTAITVAIISILTLLNVDVVIANFLGFIAGLANSFYFNRRYTFRSLGKNVALPFLCSFALAYGANIAMVLAAEKAVAIHSLFSQAAGVITYNVVFFILMKIWVFAGESEPS